MSLTKESNTMAQKSMASVLETTTSTSNPSVSTSQDQIPPQIHLHQMDISSQLRSLSQLSSDFECSQDQEPRPSLNCARSPATSSVYSRPSSATDSPDLNSYFEIPHDLETTLASWPNWREEKVLEPLRDFSIEFAASPERERSPALPLPPDPGVESGNSSPASLSTLSTKREGLRTWLRPSLSIKPPQSKRSASVLTTTSRASRLFSRAPWTAAKKLQKRQSFAQFLRSVGRKPQESPNLTSPCPNPQATSHHQTFPAPFFDGPTDDPALLGVNTYELEDAQTSSSRKHRFRSASVSQLRPMLHADTASAGRALLFSEATHRDTTLEEYERALTSVGDDRRRPSAVNLRFWEGRSEEVAEEDEEEGEESGEEDTRASRRRSRATLAAAIGIKPQRRLSRAHPLPDPANPLMASALEKHQQEKALFRSASKQKEAAAERASERNLASNSSASGGNLADVQRHRLLLLESGHHQQPRKKGLEVLGLSTPDSRDRGTVRSRSLGFLIPAYSRAEALLSRGREGTRTATAPADDEENPALDPSTPVPSTLDAALAPSWSRYPSHSRAKRSGSAGQDDAVFVRDFGAESHDARRGRTDSDNTVDVEPRGRRDGLFSPRLRASNKEEGAGKKKQKTVTVRKSRSLTFSGIVRYYSNLLHTSGFSGQNRRSSVAVGGRVEHPELEMLAGHGER